MPEGVVAMLPRTSCSALWCANGALVVVVCCGGALTELLLGCTTELEVAGTTRSWGLPQREV